MKCISCKSGSMEKSTATYMTSVNNFVIIIKNVPCIKCKQCGEVLYNSLTLGKIDKMIEDVQKLASEITVLDYSKVA